MDIAAVPARRNEAYSVELHKPFAQHPIASRRDCNFLQKNHDVTYLHKFMPKHPARMG